MSVVLVRSLGNRRPLSFLFPHASPLRRTPDPFLRLGVNQQLLRSFITADAPCPLGWHHNGVRGLARQGNHAWKGARMFVAIRYYQTDPDSTDEVVRLVKEGLVPLMRYSPGFVS